MANEFIVVGQKHQPRCVARHLLHTAGVVVKRLDGWLPVTPHNALLGGFILTALV